MTTPNPPDVIAKPTPDILEQYSTFLVANNLYGIDVKRVQEVVRPLPITDVPLSANYVQGLINLRGQIATAIGLRQLFVLENADRNDLMNVVCKADGDLISLQVDEIGDVVEVSKESYEATPQTVPEGVRKFVTGVYKVRDRLLSVIDINRIAKYLAA